MAERTPPGLGTAAAALTTMLSWLGLAAILVAVQSGFDVDDDDVMPFLGLVHAFRALVGAAWVPAGSRSGVVQFLWECAAAYTVWAGIGPRGVDDDWWVFLLFFGPAVSILAPTLWALSHRRGFALLPCVGTWLACVCAYLALDNNSDQVVWFLLGAMALMSVVHMEHAVWVLRLRPWRKRRESSESP